MNSISKRALQGVATAFILPALLALVSGCSSIPHHNHHTACDEAVFCDDSGCDAMACDAMTFDGEVSCDGSLPCDAMLAGNHHQLVRGRPNRFLDSTGSFLGFANKIALWDRRADCHAVSPQTEQEVLAYLRRNQLGSVLVRSNQYDPLGEWRRLVANDHMAAPWKYTFGTYDWLKYTLIPGRLVGGDWYNPFTDTVHLYSDIPSIGLAKAAYAKDVHGRDYPGTYAAIQDTPLLGLWHEGIANTEVIRHLKTNGTRTEVKEAERILYPDFGGALGAQVLGFLPYGNVYGRAAGALTGHAYRAVTKGELTARSSSTGKSDGGTIVR